MTPNRRTLIRLLPLAATGALLGDLVHAQAMVDEKDPQAAGLGYVADATRADKAKYTKYAAGQNCSTCQLFQGKAGATGGACPLFAGKQVAAKGWCSAYAKKA